MNKKAGEGRQSPVNVPRLNAKVTPPSSPVQTRVAKEKDAPPTKTTPNLTPPPVKRAPSPDVSGDEHQHKELLRSTTFNLSDISDDDAAHIEKCVCPHSAISFSC